MAINWQLVLRRNYVAQQITDNSHIPIPQIQIQIQNPCTMILVGVSNPQTKPTWKNGAIAYCRSLLQVDGSVFNGTLANITESIYCQVNRLTLISLPSPNLGMLHLELNIPEWHNQMLVEIWRDVE